MSRITFSAKDAELLYEIIHHCNEHQTWMREVFENGERMIDLEEKLIDFTNENREVGRPKTTDVESVKLLKTQGKTQEQISRELSISLSTVRRYWK